MFSFSEIVGHEQIKEHMQAAIRDKKPFHAYLFQGEEGVGKEALARTFAAGLQCQSESADKPCKECVSCRQMESGNQPDVIWVTREKASLGVDEIREQLCNTMDIKPFSSPYKIYLVPEAEKMTEAAQNALLKTIEEPPEYGIVILMTSNISALLPTIQSRCLTMEFRPLSTAVVESYVKEHCQVPDYQARASAAFAQGNLGKAMRYAKSEDFIERKDHIIWCCGTGMCFCLRRQRILTSFCSRMRRLIFPVRQATAVMRKSRKYCRRLKKQKSACAQM